MADLSPSWNPAHSLAPFNCFRVVDRRRRIDRRAKTCRNPESRRGHCRVCLSVQVASPKISKAEGETDRSQRVIFKPLLPLGGIHRILPPLPATLGPGAHEAAATDHSFYPLRKVGRCLTAFTNKDEYNASSSISYMVHYK